MELNNLYSRVKKNIDKTEGKLSSEHPTVHALSEIFTLPERLLRLAFYDESLDTETATEKYIDEIYRLENEALEKGIFTAEMLTPDGKIKDEYSLLHDFMLWNISDDLAEFFITEAIKSIGKTGKHLKITATTE